MRAATTQDEHQAMDASYSRFARTLIVPGAPAVI
jgi:hypothetical protein